MGGEVVVGSAGAGAAVDAATGVGAGAGAGAMVPAVASAMGFFGGGLGPWLVERIA